MTRAARFPRCQAPKLALATAREELARLHRAIALHAMIAEGMTQREVAKALGISQPAVNQQLSSSDLTDVHPELLLEAATPASAGTSTFSFIRFERSLEQVLGREIDLVAHGGLKPRRDEDIRRETVLL